MVKHILLAILCCLPAGLFAQQKLSSNNDDALKAYWDADKSIDLRLYDQAIAQLKISLVADSNFLEARIRLADLYRITHHEQNAAINYRKIIAANPEFSRSVYYNLGQMELYLANYAVGEEHLRKYLTYPNLKPEIRDYVNLLIADCEFSIEAMKHPVPFKPVNIGPEINSAYDDYLPVITADENELIFTRDINNNEDLYKSIKQNGKWTKAVYLSDNINTKKYREGAQSITPDGEYLFFAGCDRPDGRGKCDIYVTKKRGDDWEWPIDLPEPINTGGWESQPSISADSRTIYFSSDRKGGYGGYDIWKSTLTVNGWSEPENLGPNVNTPYNEQSPFIHPDDNTLYFSSDGWPGMGRMDIFLSRRGADGKWQKAQNLGYPINTSADDSGLTLNATGDKAFFTSNKLDGYGGFDIYTFDMPLDLRPTVVTYVKGAVTDAKTDQAMQATVEIIDLESNKVVYQDQLNAEGKFLATLTTGKDYGLNISKKGYLFYSENFSLKGDQSSKQAFQIKIPLQVIEAGGKIVLKNIFFDTNKFDLKPESIAELGKIINFLRDNPTVDIEISGFTDNMGDDVLNQRLSQSRAKSVYDYLVGQLISPARLTYKGYGKSQAIAPNTTEDGRKQNRRTELKITSYK